MSVDSLSRGQVSKINPGSYDNHIQYYYHRAQFELESGSSLSEFTLAYRTFGKLNPKKDNVVWVVHALTGDSNPMAWWPGVVGNQGAIDPNKHFIVCVNCLGSPYGSTNPLSISPDTNQAYFHDFPLLTNRDVVKSFDHLRRHLQLDQIKLLIGASLGGQQVLEWSILKPSVFENIVLIATNAFHSPWGIAFNESQRLCIEADQTWKLDHADAGKFGLLAARSVALLSYRTAKGYNDSQKETESKIDGFKAQSYQRYQGQKLVDRFNAFSYWVLSKMMDSHHVGRGKISIEQTLATIQANALIIGINSDLLFPLEEQQFLHKHIPNSSLEVIDSILGHDGFLTESTLINAHLNKILC